MLFCPGHHLKGEKVDDLEDEEAGDQEKAAKQNPIVRSELENLRRFNIHIFYERLTHFRKMFLMVF